MDSILPSSVSSNGVALFVASLIFIVTIILVSRQLINFTVTLVLLFFAIVSGFAIANNDIVRSYLIGQPVVDAKTAAAAETAFDERLSIIETNLRQIFDQLVDLLSNKPEPGVKPEQDKEKTKQLKVSIGEMLDDLNTQRPHLRQLLDSRGKDDR